MTYDISLRKTDFNKDPFFTELEYSSLQEEEENDYDLLTLNVETISKCFKEIIYTYQYPEKATEGLGESFNVIFKTLEVVIKFISDVTKWLTKKIKTVINIRRRIKEYRDKKMETLSSIYTGLNPTEQIEANRRFLDYTISYTPSYLEYGKMCIAFSQLIKIFVENVNKYIGNNIIIVPSIDPKQEKTPTWVNNLYTENASREALKIFGIRWEENNFVQKSPFKIMTSQTLNDLKYNSVENIRTINSLYLSHCWTNLKQIIILKNRFEKFEYELRNKQKELTKNTSNLDKNEIVKSCNNTILSVGVTLKLITYLINIDSGLDTRRGWLIDKAIKACSIHEE